MNLVVFLRAMVRKRLARDLAPGKPATIGEDRRHQHVGRVARFATRQRAGDPRRL